MLLSRILRECFFFSRSPREVCGGSEFGDNGGGVRIGWESDECSLICRIQTWALEEARRRLEVEGILKEPESKS